MRVFVNHQCFQFRVRTAGVGPVIFTHAQYGIYMYHEAINMQNYARNLASYSGSTLLNN